MSMSATSPRRSVTEALESVLDRRRSRTGSSGLMRPPTPAEPHRSATSGVDRIRSTSHRSTRSHMSAGSVSGVRRLGDATAGCADSIAGGMTDSATVLNLRRRRAGRPGGHAAKRPAWRRPAGPRHRPGALRAEGSPRRAGRGPAFSLMAPAASGRAARGRGRAAWPGRSRRWGGRAR
jgi:hypothetical protein